MGYVIFGCKHCNRITRASVNNIGRLVSCHECGKNNTVRNYELEIDCPHCSESLQVSEKLLGKIFNCPKCDKQIKIENDSEEEDAETSTINSQDDSLRTREECVQPQVLFKCKECKQHLAANLSIVGKSFRCVHCNAVCWVPEPTLELECPSCKSDISFTNDLFGERVDCPSCGKVIEIPETPDITATCPKCGNNNVPFICPNCEKQSGGMTITDDGSVECYCGINSNQITCPYCAATIIKKWFRYNPLKSSLNAHKPIESRSKVHRLKKQSSVGNDSQVNNLNTAYYPLQIVCDGCGSSDYLLCKICNNSSSFVLDRRGAVCVCGNVIEHVECHCKHLTPSNRFLRANIDDYRNALSSVSHLQAPLPMQTRGSKNRSAAILLAIFFGNFGFHEFYLNQPIAGVTSLLLCWTGIPWLIAIFEALGWLFMSDESFRQKYG